MFDRYTEAARRALFFARYEVSERGGTAIETEHILLGVAREPKGVVARILTPLLLEEIRREVEAQPPRREKLDESIEIPFTIETKRALQFTADEADRLGHDHIGTEHLLLGLLREDTSAAASILKRHGLGLDAVRNTIVQTLRDRTALTSDAGDASEQIDQLKLLVARLARKVPDQRVAGELVDRITLGLEQLRAQFGR
jgi:ATP-dependent Clp protease ATP-binding subunit ClpC